LKEKQGNLAEIGLPRLLHEIYKEADPTSFLDIVREPVKKRFFFKNGMPVYATSNVLGEVLGRLLMAENIISQKDYENSLEIVLKEKRRHGEVLTSMGLITTGELENFLALQLKRRIWRIFDWKEGAFEYKLVDTLPGGINPMPLHPAELILDGISLGFYPLPQIKEDMQGHLDDKAVQAIDHSVYRLTDFGLNLQETRFFKSFDGKKSLREILEGSDLLRQRALSLALSFLITETIDTEPSGTATAKESAQPELSGMAPESSGMDSRLSAELLFMKAKTAIRENDYSGAAAMLREITELNPVEGEYWAWLGWAIFRSDPGRAAEAEGIIKDSIDLNNELDIAWYFLAMVSLAEKKMEAARTAFETAVLKNPWMLSAVAELKCLEINRSLQDAGGLPERGYMKIHRFESDPFSPGPLNCLFTPTTNQNEALEFLERTIKKKAGPLLLEGAEGLGKTAIGIELLKRLSNKKILAAMILEPPGRELDLIKSINEELGATAESGLIKELLLSLGMRVSQNKTQGGHTIIIIDRAERLTDGCLKLVQYLARLKTLQLVLIAGEELKDRLALPNFKELNEKLIARFNLNPFSEEESRTLVDSRLALAAEGGDNKTFSFSPDESRELYIKSSGVASSILEEAALYLEKAADATGGEGGSDTTGAIHMTTEEPETKTIEDILTTEEPEAKTTEDTLTTEEPEAKTSEGVSVEAEGSSLLIGEVNTDLSAIDILGSDLSSDSDEGDEGEKVAEVTGLEETTGIGEDGGLEKKEQEGVSLEVTSLLDSLNEELDTPEEAPSIETLAPLESAPPEEGLPLSSAEGSTPAKTREMEKLPLPLATGGGVRSTPQKNRRSGALTFIIWFIIMLTLGLGAGAFFGIYLNR
jgi:type II secretory pathway predicted ATPase ExeA